MTSPDLLLSISLDRIFGIKKRWHFKNGSNRFACQGTKVSAGQYFGARSVINFIFEMMEKIVYYREINAVLATSLGYPANPVNSSG